MGLDCTHGAWNGPYSHFNEFRRKIARHGMGVELETIEGHGGDTPWSALPVDDLRILLNHSDCDGEIEPDDCLKLARRLLDFLDHLSVANNDDRWVRDRAAQFAEGCLRAYTANEPLEFL
jgi:hypothetical protein